jgi:hypothetical protein
MHETYTTVVGNIATPVDLRNLQDGTVLANFRVATTERRRDRDRCAYRGRDRRGGPVIDRSSIGLPLRLLLPQVTGWPT